ncbi:hypothetical protein FRAHR75_10076 [Frankia sp. Hr75.2]|nr:hypothetical protein FRAHR75_10076 [Frankia sp. Hr75.2]
MSRLLCQTELHRHDGSPASEDPTDSISGQTTNCRSRSCPIPDRLSPFTESNRRPSPYHGDALPTELKGRARAGLTLHDSGDFVAGTPPHFRPAPTVRLARIHARPARPAGTCRSTRTAGG